ncbi:GTPase domain-containing protein [endosymbiont of Ridgeia piscesae]|jgi:GTPase SAR1 family protein|uniref:50S ribosome-binding GTPase n=1 Tax=endosymbiont of Ridgeia piscesae TaxID=54398 RepID=A0A0T5YY33_9GAMM|nr:GTPase domain-containing protein [endosymbiont of Ridgeia piscesae]KRT55568.1 50S ribosome-binding GTPase [endosymbiont of Ridgeia piscesae]KRT59490.1 50S ribosome-binding GTPase [endosymbiont of Ridgeia piscesae]
MSDETDTLLHFLERLQRRAEGVADSDPESPFADPLNFAISLLRRSGNRPTLTGLPPQLAVIGPTQSGKSSLVNLLLDQSAAEASPLAGFTQHPQGFSTTTLSSEQRTAITVQFPDWRLADNHPPGEADDYSLCRLDFGSRQQAAPLLIWDSPDFDSVSARHYRHRIPTLCAMADAILLVVSREKYADQSVWRLLRLIAPVGLPLVICLNKTSHEEARILTQTLAERLQQESITYLGIVALPYLPEGEATLADTPEAGALRRTVTAAIEQRTGTIPQARLAELLQHYWPAWSKPLQEEHSAAQQWATAIDNGIAEALAIYQRDYLEHSNYEETFQRAIAELLQLLEIPGLAPVLSRARHYLSWPARQLGKLIQTDKGDGNETGHEAQVLNDAVRHLLLSLQQQLGEQASQSGTPSNLWWSQLGVALLQQQTALSQQAADAIQAHQHAFEPEIRQAGEQLYQHLQHHPGKLHSLRATRATLDAAGIAFALKTGGIGISDLLFAPAMLAFTSSLAESAGGHYMHTIREQLKARQRLAVESRIFDQALGKQLRQLAQQMPCEGLFQINAGELAQATDALEKLTS